MRNSRAILGPKTDVLRTPSATSMQMNQRPMVCQFGSMSREKQHQKLEMRCSVGDGGIWHGTRLGASGKKWLEEAAIDSFGKEQYCTLAMGMTSGSSAVIQGQLVID